MYIKEIRLHGFKSFADKTVIELNQSFTGIVGPNGSGKSNIVDGCLESKVLKPFVVVIIWQM